jgi:hypothetical protein
MMNSMTNENVEWGPEIVVSGKRPEWLKDDDLIRWCWPITGWVERECPARVVSIENGVTHIRLHANHAYYHQPTPAPTPDMAGEMEALVRRLADNKYTGFDWHEDAIDLVSRLAPLPDPDIQVARDIWADAADDASDDYRQFIREGAYDTDRTFRAVLAALKRGKQ